MNKKDFLLQTIIKAYIQDSEPIGSTYLKNMYSISYSSATIRGYFKKLGDEGYLIQEHVSSGRTPTNEALRDYWSERLDFILPEIEFEKIKYYANKQDLTVFIRRQTNEKLIKVLNIENNYMLLQFDNSALNLIFNKPLFKFLNDMIGLNLQEIFKVAHDIGITKLKNELSNIIDKNTIKRINLKAFLKICVDYDLNDAIINKFLNGEIFIDKLSKGINFESILPDGFIGINHDTTMDDAQVNLLVLGHLSKNYEYFYKGISA